MTKKDFVMQYVINRMSLHTGYKTNPSFYKEELEFAKLSANLAWQAIIDDELESKLDAEEILIKEKAENIAREKRKNEERLEKKFAKFLWDIEELECCVRELSYIVETDNLLSKKQFRELDKPANLICSFKIHPEPHKQSMEVVKKNTNLFKNEVSKFVNIVNKYELTNKDKSVKSYFKRIQKTLTTMKDAESYV